MAVCVDDREDFAVSPEPVRRRADHRPRESTEDFSAALLAYYLELEESVEGGGAVNV